MLSYILDVSQRKWPKSKHLNAIHRIVEAEIKRCETMYFEHAEDY